MIHLKYHLKKARHRAYIDLKNCAGARKILAQNKNRYSGSTRSVLLDMYRCQLLYSISPNEYLRYGFEKKTAAERKKYVSGLALRMTVRDLNRDAVSDKILKDKYLLAEKIPEYFKRDFVLVRNGQDMTEAAAFLRKHGSFILKPRNSNYGKGIRIVRLGPAEEEGFIAELERTGEDYILEELIPQDEALACFHPASVNTMRVVACFTEGKTQLLFTMLRMGCGDSFLDNTSTGGIFALADPQTGVIISKGYRKNGEIHDAHPDTGVPFAGYRIPKWDEMVKMTDELAHIFPDLRLIGWDFALSERGWCVVEGNNGPGFNGPQICLDRGIREEAERMLGIKIR